MFFESAKRSTLLYRPFDFYKNSSGTLDLSGKDVEASLSDFPSGLMLLLPSFLLGLSSPEDKFYSESVNT
jgi:hypothetical protein